MKPSLWASYGTLLVLAVALVTPLPAQFVYMDCALGNNVFTFKAEGTGVDLTGLATPLTVVLTIGIDSGSTPVTVQVH